MNTPPSKAKLISIGVLVLVGGIIITIFIKRITATKAQRELRKTKESQKKETKETKYATKTIISTMQSSDYFNPNYYKKVKGARLLTEPSAIGQAKKIRKALKGVGTNETLLFATFRGLYRKVQVSQVADYYQRLYKRDMITDIIKDLSKKQLYSLYEIVKTLL